MSGEWRRRAAELKAAATRKRETSQDNSGAAEFDRSISVFAADRMATGPEAAITVQSGQYVHPEASIGRIGRIARPPSMAAENSGADRSNTGASVDAFEEMAATVEFDAGIPRPWAEGYAAMQHAKPPAWAALRLGLWSDLINAVGLFLDRWGRQAAELGWDPIDLFGASPRAPLARVDQQGLLFFLQDGCEIVAMTADTATIRRSSGVVQTFRRPSKNAREPGTAPIWELVKETKP